MLGWEAADLFLDRRELANTLHRLFRDRRSGRFVEFVEPAAQMRPAERQLDRPLRPARLFQDVVAGISVDLNDAAEPLQMLGDMLAAPAVRIDIDQQWRRRPDPWPVIDRISPR